MSRGASLVLVGYRCVGKTTLGQRVAEGVSAPFVDTDLLVESLASEPISRILEGEGGLERLRSLESAAIASIDPLQRQVVATGGGAIIAAENRERLRRLGPTVWLAAEVETLTKRLEGAPRPSLTGAPAHREVYEVLLGRSPLYCEVASAVLRVDGRSFEELSDELQQLWRNFSGDHLR